MKKFILRSCLLLTLLLLLSGCNCEHEWEDATCIAPKECKVCGAKEGSPVEHKWEDATCTAPKECKVCGVKEGTPAEHYWKDATCQKPKECLLCGLQEGSALEHYWYDATCMVPKRCSRCNQQEGSALGHDWTEETKTTPKSCKRCSVMEPMYAKNGQVYIGKERSGSCNLTIKCSTSESYYVKLKNTSNKDIFSFFVRAGKTVEIAVPREECYVYFASGQKWYGPEYLFGSNTSYSMDEDLVDFSIYAVTYELIPKAYGNFSETAISADAF